MQQHGNGKKPKKQAFVIVGRKARFSDELLEGKSLCQIL